jgi:hypothetical protein
MPVGRLAHFHKPIQTVEMRDAADAAAALLHFARMGWDLDSQEVDQQLDALLARARGMQDFRERCKLLPPAALAAQQSPTFWYSRAA